MQNEPQDGVDYGEGDRAEHGTPHTPLEAESFHQPSREPKHDNAAEEGQ